MTEFPVVISCYSKKSFGILEKRGIAQFDHDSVAAFLVAAPVHEEGQVVTS